MDLGTFDKLAELSYFKDFPLNFQLFWQHWTLHSTTSSWKGYDLKLLELRELKNLILGKKKKKARNLKFFHVMITIFQKGTAVVAVCFSLLCSAFKYLFFNGILFRFILKAARGFVHSANITTSSNFLSNIF